MKRLTLLILVCACLVGVTAAQAKFEISLAVQPAQPWAKKPARVLVRTSIVLPRGHGLLLHVVGPGAARHETTAFEYRLRRTGPRTFAATVRFPRGGRWRLIVPNWNDRGSTSPPPVDRTVKVQPSP